jgi:hypothetical protein
LTFLERLGSEKEAKSELGFMAISRTRASSAGLVKPMLRSWSAAAAYTGST